MRITKRIDDIRNGIVVKTTINRKWYRIWYGQHINKLIGKTVHVTPISGGSEALSHQFENNEHYEKGGKTYRKAVDLAEKIEKLIKEEIKC